MKQRELSNSEIMKCSSCGSFNLSLDMCTGKTMCNDCNANDKPKKIFAEDYRDDNIATEEKRHSSLEVMGTQVKIDEKRDDVNGLNDFSKMGI